MRDGNAIEPLQSLGTFAKSLAEVHMHSETKAMMRGMFFFRYLLQAVKATGVFGIYTFVDDEEPAAFNRNQRAAAERTVKDRVPFNRIGIREKGIAADLAEELVFIALVLVKV